MSFSLSSLLRRSRTGYWRGVPFRLDGYGLAGGRRHELHEYPLRDEPLAEDLGRRARKFTFTCYVLGRAYEAQRDALLNALEEEGPGILRHPFFGEQFVQVDTYAVSESRASGTRIAAFELSFVETTEEFTYPTNDVNPSLEVVEGVGAATGGSLDAFGSGWTITGFASFVPADAAAMIDDLVDTMAGLVDRSVVDIEALGDLLDNLGRLTQGFGLTARQRAALPDAPAFVAQSPAVVGEQINRAITALGLSIIDDDGQALYAMAVLAAWQTSLPAVVPIRRQPSPVIYTPTRRRQLQNRIAMTDLIQRSAGLAAARRLVTVRERNALAAQSQRQQFDTLFFPILAGASSQNDRAMRGLRRAYTATVSLLSSRIKPSEQAATWDMNTALPSHVCAHAIHREGRRSDALVRDNPVPHPSFMRRVILAVPWP